VGTWFLSLLIATRSGSVTFIFDLTFISFNALSFQTSNPMQPILIDGQWITSQAAGTFQAENPATKTLLPEVYPISSWSDCEAALTAAANASVALRNVATDQLALFLDTFANLLEQRATTLVTMANAETGLPKAPRLADVELPRTTTQLRQAASAVREGSWSMPTVDTKNNIRSYFAPLGPVCVFGPNNFPFAFNSMAGGDFAAAIAAGNPVIAKANSSHPGTTYLLAQAALDALLTSGLPMATVQLLYRTSHADGERLVADARMGAIGYTGSRAAGLKLKAVADAAGKPIYLELSSVNPVVLLPGALQQRCTELAVEFSTSCLMGAGQFCTNPGLVLLVKGESTDAFIASITEKFNTSPAGTLLSRSVWQSLQTGLQTLQAAGAQRLTNASTEDAARYCHANTLLHTSGQAFLEHPHALQTEAFGNASLLVVCDDVTQLCQVIDALEGNLTGSIYSDTQGSDDAIAATVAFHLRPKVGRLLNDKMPTGVAVSPAMNHGGPYPATGHPGFTAVGIPASIHRFAMLQSFDNVRLHRLPAILQNINPQGRAWRNIDGRWTKEDIG
jgi:2,5-dioxopentanoate dehydrogenase